MNNQLERDETKLKSKLSGYYDTEARKLEKEIGAFYQQYGKDDIIEYRTLMQTMSEEDRKLLTERMNDFQNKYPEYGYILPVRENIYKLNRLEGLQQSILMQQYEMGAIDEATLKKHLEKQALLGANAMAKELGFGENFYSMNPDIIKKLINQKWANGSNFSDSIWKNRQKLADYLNSDFAAGIARGDNYQKLIRDLQKKFGNVSRRDMYRLIYTEGTFALNEGMITPFEEDFEEYRFSIADSNACGKCQAINGKKYSIKDRKPGVNFPPLHSWCRCSFTIEIPDNFIEQYEAKHGGKPPSKVLQDSPKAGTMKSQEQGSERLNMLTESLNSMGVDYNPVAKHNNPLTPDEIIQALSGGDKTKGSCASLGLAYIGQKGGMNVLDFRGGKSQEFFSMYLNLKEITKLDKTGVIYETARATATVGNKLLKRVEVGKEYYLVAGRHASIVRKTNDGVFQYLELQSAKNSGWTNFNDNPRYTFSTRFGCTQTGSNYEGFMIDVDQFKDSSELQKLLGYINTSVSGQKKGVGGSVK